jgi:hypothetical protein
MPSFEKSKTSAPKHGIAARIRTEESNLKKLTRKKGKQQ